MDRSWRCKVKQRAPAGVQGESWQRAPGAHLPVCAVQQILSDAESLLAPSTCQITILPAETVLFLNTAEARVTERLGLRRGRLPLHALGFKERACFVLVSRSVLLSHLERLISLYHLHRPGIGGKPFGSSPVPCLKVGVYGSTAAHKHGDICVASKLFTFTSPAPRDD